MKVVETLTHIGRETRAKWTLMLKGRRRRVVGVQ